MLRESLYEATRELARQPFPTVRAVVDELADKDRRAVELALRYDWPGMWRRPKQQLPKGDWLWALYSCGRGWGKTRASMEFLRGFAEGGEDEYVAVVGATHLTLQRDLLAGPSGILTISPPWFRPTYHPTKSELRWPKHPVTGVRMRAALMSGDKPDRIRGTEVSKALLDEMPTWQDPTDAWMNIELILRRGTNRRGIITCTLKRKGAGSLFSRDLLWGKRGADGVRRQRPDMVTIHGATEENRALDRKTIEDFKRRFGGTADEVTELEGKLPTEAEGALWIPEDIERFRVDAVPVGVKFDRVVTSVDPTRSKSGAGDLCGIITGALGSDGHAYIFSDDTLRAPPEIWIEAAIGVAERNRSDYGIYEQNRMGDDLVILIEEKARRHRQSWKPITARKDKRDRAEPVAALCRSGRVHHIGHLPELEEEQCAWDPEVPERQASPDRIDAYVHLNRELLLSETARRKKLVVR